MSLFDFITKPKVLRLKARSDIQGLIKALEYEKDYVVPQQARDALVAIGLPAVEGLIAMLNQHDLRGTARNCGIAALGEIGDARGLDSIIAALRYENHFIRCAAAKALGKMGHRSAVEALLNALQTRRSFTAEAIQNFQSQIQQGYSFEVDMEMSAFRLQEAEEQIAIVKALEETGDSCAIGILLSFQEALQAAHDLFHDTAKPEGDDSFAVSVQKAERKLVEAVDQALATLSTGA